MLKGTDCHSSPCSSMQDLDTLNEQQKGAELVMIQTECDTATTECDTATTECDTVRNEMVPAERDIARRELVAVEAERDAARDALVAVEAERDAARGELVAVKVERDAARNALVAERADWAVLATKLQLREQNAVTLRDNILQIVNGLRFYQPTCAANNEQQNGAELVMIQTECDTATTECDTATTECGTATTECDTVRDEMVRADIARRELVAVEAERDAARGELVNVKAERDAARDALVAERADWAALVTKLQLREQNAETVDNIRQIINGLRDYQPTCAANNGQASASIEVITVQGTLPDLGAYESAVPNGVPVDDTSDRAREFSSSGSARACLLRQFEGLNVDDLKKYYEMEKKVASCEALQAEKDELIADKETLEEELIAQYSNVITLRADKMNRERQGGEVSANDNMGGNNSAEDGENPHKVEPPELARFSSPFNCEVSCSSSVVLCILHRMGLRLCFQKLMREVQCTLSKIPEAKCEVGNCSSSLRDFSKAGLLEANSVFDKDITAEYTINDALRDARAKINGPAVLAMEYEMEPDGTQPVGHSVMIMPSGDCIDVKYRRYWEPKPDRRISCIQVVKVKNSGLAEWQRKCGLQKCEDECRTCSSYSTESLG